MSKVLIIAEAGVNHNGSLAMAKKLVEAAVEAGADIVKFQTFVADQLVSAQATKADYQIGHNDDSTQLEMLKKLELTHDFHYQLIDHCKKKGIAFFSTAFDDPSIEFLASLNLNLWKIPSGEITNLPYLKKIGEFNQKVILSTGMSTLEEVQGAIAVLMEAGTTKDNITVLHCNTEYPTPMMDVNLRAMLTIQNETGLAIGYSDHTLGIEVPIAAVALGAVVIEKHFTLDRTLPGPDHRASLEPTELKAMVSAIRNIELALGDGLKKPSPSEQKNILIARKSIHLKDAIAAGVTLMMEHLIMKRPGDGISPMKTSLVLGRKTTKNLPKDTKISFTDLQ